MQNLENLFKKVKTIIIKAQNLKTNEITNNVYADEIGMFNSFEDAELRVKELNFDLQNKAARNVFKYTAVEVEVFESELELMKLN